MAEHTEQRFSSRWVMMLTMLGMAVGTGNIWRFPRIAAQNGVGLDCNGRRTNSRRRRLLGGITTHAEGRSGAPLERSGGGPT